jgi:hypothetical protein
MSLSTAVDSVICSYGRIIDEDTPRVGVSESEILRVEQLKSNYHHYLSEIEKFNQDDVHKFVNDKIPFLKGHYNLTGKLTKVCYRAEIECLEYYVLNKTWPKVKTRVEILDRLSGHDGLEIYRTLPVAVRDLVRKALWSDKIDFHLDFQDVWPRENETLILKLLKQFPEIRSSISNEILAYLENPDEQ